MRTIVVVLLLSAIIGCTGVGFVATSDPNKKLAQANALMDQDRALLAEDVIKQALEIFQKDGDELGMADAYHTYGNLYKHTSYHVTWAAKFKELGTYDGTYMKSISNYEKAIKLFEKNNEETGVVKCLVGIGNAYAGRGENEKECKYYKEALSRYQSAKKEGRLNREPVIFDKRYNNLGELIEAFIQGYCR